MISILVDLNASVLTMNSILQVCAVVVICYCSHIVQGADRHLICLSKVKVAYLLTSLGLSVVSELVRTISTMGKIYALM